MTLDPTLPRDAVAAAGRQRLLRHGIDALRSQLNASVLARESPVSKDTAYRVFRADETGEGVTDAIIAAVATAVEDWTHEGYDAALGDAMAAFQASASRSDDTASHIIAALEATFEAQFRSPGVPTGWMLEAPALTASRAWKGDAPAADGVAVARTILESRRALYERTTEKLVGLARVAMSELGRRPRPGVDLRSVVVMTHALLDGAILRRLLDPDAVPAELVARTMFQVWMANSEPGPDADPRKPDDDHDRALFDRLLDEAAGLWQAGTDVTVDAAAAQAAVAPGDATRLFPEVGDLADSLVRARVAGGGFTGVGPEAGQTEARKHVLVLVTELQRLRDLADALPHAVAAAQAHPPVRSTSFTDDLIDHHTRVIERLGLTAHPQELVEDLVRFAVQGEAGWPSVMALLRTIGHRPDPTA